MRVRSVLFPLALLALALPGFAQMPDMQSMSGVPLPASDLPAGTVSVRVVRGDISNNVAGQVVELHGGAAGMKATTDESGRAVFSGLAPGTTVHAMTVLDGKQLESQDFPVPGEGGIKVMLVGGADAGSAPPAASAAPASPPAPTTPAVPGSVSLAGQSRIIVEVTDDGMDVYNLFDIANSTGAPVTTEPLVFEVPRGAEALTVLEESSPQAVVDGRRFVVRGPFAPGLTNVQLAYRLHPDGESVSFQQVLPVDLTTISLIVRKFGGMRFRSPQAGSVREMTSNGTTYFSASGQTLPAGMPVQLEFEGLPYHSKAPRYLALGLAVFVLGFGVWLAVNGPDQRLVAKRQALEQRRVMLLDDLVGLERELAGATSAPPKLVARRQALLEQLERVYEQLDRDLTASALGTSEPRSVKAGAARAQAAR